MAAVARNDMPAVQEATGHLLRTIRRRGWIEEARDKQRKTPTLTIFAKGFRTESAAFAKGA